MSEELLRYYQQELTYLRHQAADFARAFPKIAGRLEIGTETIRDPHVERLMEAFAFLTARIRHKLDDDFPEISEALLNVLYPHYLTPTPSAAIVQFVLDRQQGELMTGYGLPRHSELETDPIDGQPCRFRTCYAVQLWPIDLKSAAFKGHPFVAPRTRFSDRAQAVLRLELETVSPKAAFADFQLDQLVFYLNGQSQHVHELYEGLFNNVVGVAVAAGADDPEPYLLPPECLQPVGLERDEGLVDYPARSFWGYRLLSELFAFPEKFLFVRLAGLEHTRARLAQRMVIFIYLNRSVRDLERNVDRETFLLGCTPIINLFPHRAEPIALNHQDSEYHVVPDARRPIAYEVYSVDRVTATSPSSEVQVFQPFYSIRHGSEKHASTSFWHASRRASEFAGGETDRGTEVYLTLVDLEFQPEVPARWSLDVELTCMNRDLPHRLPFGGGEPRLQLTVGAPVSQIQCLTPPTPTFRPWLRHGTLWRLISHLSLNHLSLVDSDSGADALREILKLYDFQDSAQTRAMIDGLSSISGRRVVGRVATTNGTTTFCRGWEVTLHLDEARFVGGGLFLFASVLERFLGLYCSINSFTKTIVTTSKREAPLKKWPARASDQVLL